MFYFTKFILKKKLPPPTMTIANRDNPRNNAAPHFIPFEREEVPSEMEVLAILVLKLRKNHTL